jgi:hypothetical protein
MKIRALISISLWCLYVIPAQAFPPAPYYRIFGTVRDQQGGPLGAGEGTVILSGIYSALNLASVSGGGIAGVIINNGGSYTSVPDVTFVGANGSGSGATGTAVLTDGVVTDVIIDNPGSGYISPVAVGFSGGGGTPVELVRSITSPSDGTNYSLSVPMDSQTISQFDDIGALSPWLPFTIKVVVNGQDFVPIQIRGATSRYWTDRINAVNTPGINAQGTDWAVGLPSGKLRLDLTIGIDSDGDGLPDSWEEDVANSLGLGSIEDVNPNDDSDGDGVSNYIEYIAGTYAFDKDDKFGLKVIDVITTGTAPEESHHAHLRFLAIPGRTYRIGEWIGSGSLKPCQFSSVRDGSGLRTSLLASEVANQDVYVPMIDGESRFFVLSVE